MGYRLLGTYIAHCDCQQICGCSVDEPPTGPNGQCHGLMVYGVRERNLNGTDLSGVTSSCRAQRQRRSIDLA